MRFQNLKQQEVKSCTFFRYGTKIECQPEIRITNEENPWGAGSIRWEWEQLLDTGVDIVLQFTKEYWIDHISVRFSDGFVPAAVSLLGSQDTVWGQKSGNALTFSVAQYCSSVILRLQASMQEIEVEKLQIGICADEEMKLHPSPRRVQKMSGEILQSDLGEVLYTENEDGQETAAAWLTEKIQRDLGCNMSGRIRIVLEKDGSMRQEQYKIAISEEEIAIRAGKRRGFLYGVSRLWQILLENPIPCCEIEDEPYQELRGFHMGLPPREEIGFFKRLIRELLMPMGYNTLFLQITAGMRLKKHPEINEAWTEACRKSETGEWPPLHHADMIAGGEVLEQEEVAELVEFAGAYGMEIIPEIQSLGHVQYMTLAHPELAETDAENETDMKKDERLEDQPPALFYRHCYCPSKEGSYQLLFDIIDEIVEVIKPSRYVHMGHDEVYQIGVCPICRLKSPAELYAEDVWKIYRHLQEKNLGMMIWSDMLQKDSGYATVPAIDLLPKDIIMLDFIWYFHLEQDLEEYLLDKGYTVAMGNLYSSHYPRFEKRIQNPKVIGGEVSTWCRPDEAVLGREGKLFDLLYTAEMLWSEKYDSAYRESYNRSMERLLPWIRSGLHGQGLFSSLKKGIKAKELELLKGRNTQRSRQLKSDFTEKEFKQPCQIDSENPAVYDGKDKAWESLLFTHATLLHEGRRPFSALKKAGCYRIEFTDGSKEEIAVEYGGNIGCISMGYAQPLQHPYFRHAGYLATYFADPVRGKTADGKEQTLYCLEWMNAGHKKIRKISCESQDNGGILLAGIKGIEFPG